MSDFWKDVKHTAATAGKIVKKETKRYSKLAGLQLKLTETKLEKNKWNTKLGEYFYKYNKKKKLTIEDKKILDTIKELDKLIKKENKYKKDIKTIKEENK